MSVKDKSVNLPKHVFECFIHYYYSYYSIYRVNYFFFVRTQSNGTKSTASCCGSQITVCSIFHMWSHVRMCQGSGRQLFPVRTPVSVTEITKLYCNRSTVYKEAYRKGTEESKAMGCALCYRSETAAAVWLWMIRNDLYKQRNSLRESWHHCCLMHGSHT